MENWRQFVKPIKIWLMVFCDWWRVSHWTDNIFFEYFCLSLLGGYMLACTPPHWHAMLWFGWCNLLFPCLTYISRESVDLSKCDFSADNGNIAIKIWSHSCVIIISSLILDRKVQPTQKLHSVRDLHT